MAAGIFDPSALPEGWFDETADPAGWFDADLVAAAGAAPPSGDQYFTNLFRDTVNGSPAGDWIPRGDRSGGFAKSLTDVVFNTVDFTQHFDFLSYEPAGIIAGDVEALAIFRCTNDAFPGGLALAIDETATTAYTFWFYSPGTDLAISAVIGGTETVLATDSFSFSTDTDYFIRAGISGSTLRLRVWAVGDSEPGTWNIEIGMGSPNLAAGYVGLFARNWPGTRTWKQFGVGVDGAAAPSAPVGSGYVPAALSGDPIAITWASGATPAAQNITAPFGCNAVYMLWSYYTNSTGNGLLAATLDGVAPDEVFELPMGGTDLIATGVAAWYDPPTESAIPLEVEWDVSPSEGPLTAVVFVESADTAGWRDADADHIDGATQQTLTLTTEPVDLFLVLDQKYLLDYPANESGYTSGLLLFNNGESGRLRFIDATGTTQAASTQDTNYSSIVAISIPGVTSAGAVELTVQDATHAHTVDNVALTQANTLAVQDSTHAHTVDNVALTQANTLAVQDSTHAHAVDSPTLTQANTLVVQDSTHAHTADNLELVQANTLAVADALHAHTADNVTLETGATLETADALHAHTADNLALTQANTIAVQDSTHGHTVDNLELVQANTLTVADALHAHTVDSPTLTQANTLSVADALHAHTADNLALTQANTLAVQDSTHAHTAESPTLGTADTLSVADALHGHTADNLELTQANTLAVADALHAHTADNVVLSQGLTLAPADALHGHTADNVALTQANTLAVQDSTHAHFADLLELEVGAILVPADALHGHTADNLELVQANTLAVADALHAHFADGVTLDIPGDAVDPSLLDLVTPADRLYFVPPGVRCYIVRAGRRLFD